MTPHTVEDLSAPSGAVEETSKGTNGIHNTTDQLLNMKLDDKKEDHGVTSNGIMEAHVENGVNKEVESNTEPPNVKPKKSVAFVPKTEDPEDSDDGMEEKPAAEGDTPAAEKPDEKNKDKTKKKRKKRSKPAPTGFEEFYCDPPITPFEHEEEKQILYDPERGFAERIEVCIQRYRARRKFDSERGNIFTKYMILGGIDSGMKPFTGGLDNELLETGTKADIERFAATDFVGGSTSIKVFQPAKPEHWVVDFTGVVKGFLSHRAPHALDLHTEEGINTCCSVIRNFLNYVLMHGVCPEYTQDLMNARAICDLAKKELWLVHQLRYFLPGPFHTSCRILYGSGKDESDSFLVMSEVEISEPDPISKKEARGIVKSAIALIGTEEMSKAAAAGDIHVIKEEDHSYEVVEIIRASEKVKNDFAQIEDVNGKKGMKPLGIMRVKHFDNPELEDEDRSEDGIEPDVDYESIEDFWLEDDILEDCFVGLKMHVMVHELNIGLKYFDTIHKLYSSFLTVLPQEKMATWREPDLNLRPPPTVENPYIEDEAGAEDFDDDEKADER